MCAPVSARASLPAVLPRVPLRSWRRHQTYRGTEIMKMPNVARAAMAALIGAALAGAAHAEIKNYEFQLLQPTIKAGADRIVTVRLVDKTSGKAVPNAVIIASRLDMSPDGMQEMATKV